MEQPLLAFIKLKEKSRKQFVDEGKRLQKDLEAAYGNLNKTKKKYYAQAEAAEKAHAALDKATAEGQAPKIDKLRATADNDTQKAEQLDREYADVVTQTNQAQVDFFGTHFPAVLNELQTLDTERIEQYKMSLQQTVNEYNQMIPACVRTYDLQAACVDSVDATADVTLFINESISGASYPPELPYEPASFVVARGSTSSVASARPASMAAPSGRKAAAAPAAANPKRGSTVPAAKKDINAMSQDELHERLAQLENDIEGQIKTKKGIATLLDCYPAGSDAKRQVEQQIKDCEAKVRELHAEVNKIEGKLGMEVSSLPDEAGGGGGSSSRGGAAPSGGGNNGADDPIICRARAVYPYEAQGEGEHSFAEGQILDIVYQDESGWWEAVVDGVRGLVPSNYVVDENAE